MHLRLQHFSRSMLKSMMILHSISVAAAAVAVVVVVIAVATTTTTTAAAAATTTADAATVADRCCIEPETSSHIMN